MRCSGTMTVAVLLVLSRRRQAQHTTPTKTQYACHVVLDSFTHHMVLIRTPNSATQAPMPTFSMSSCICKPT